jgi:hypothetical protein
MKLKHLFENKNLFPVKSLQDPKWEQIISTYKVIGYIDDYECCKLFIIKDIPAIISNEKFEQIICKYFEIMDTQLKSSMFTDNILKHIAHVISHNHVISEVGDFNVDESYYDYPYPFKTLVAVYFFQAENPNNFKNGSIVSFKKFMEQFMKQYEDQDDFS